MSNDFIVHQVLDSLPSEYKQLKLSYNVLRNKWSIGKLIYVCVQEEDILNCKRAEKVHLTMIALSKKSKNNKKRFKFQKRYN